MNCEVPPGPRGRGADFFLCPGTARSAASKDGTQRGVQVIFGNRRRGHICQTTGREPSSRRSSGRHPRPLGDGVVAGVLLNRSKDQDCGLEFHHLPTSFPPFAGIVCRACGSGAHSDPAVGLAEALWWWPRSWPRLDRVANVRRGPDRRDRPRHDSNTQHHSPRLRVMAIAAYRQPRIEGEGT